MKIENFREVLLKKAEGNSNLQTLIYHIKDDYLAEYVVESLEKMAMHNRNRGSNAVISAFANQADDNTLNMMYDALSHHASKYKAALNDKRPDIANAHMSKLFNIMHLAHKMTADKYKNHTEDAVTGNAKLKIHAIDPKPWERSKFQNMNEKGQFTTDTKGWSFGGKDFDFLQRAPHASYGKEIKVHGHNKAYPLEEIRFNDKHLHIKDDEKSSGKFEPHTFDNHPIMKYYSTPSKNLSPEHINQFIKESHDFESSPHFDDFISNYDYSPERGKNKPSAVHADIEPLKLPEVTSSSSVSARPHPRMESSASIAEKIRQAKERAGNK